jgi:hypothetical protein
MTCGKADGRSPTRRGRVERKPGDTGEAGTLAQRRHDRPPRRNKLVYKNRWLISVNIIASLRRAGVVCDIIAPEASSGGGSTAALSRLDPAASTAEPEDVLRQARTLH